MGFTFSGGFVSGYSGLRNMVGEVGSGNMIGLGGGLTIRPLPDGSTNRKAKRGLGRMMASHHVSADHQRCFPLGMFLRLGVEMLALSTELRGDGFKYAGTSFDVLRGSRRLKEILGAFNNRPFPFSTAAGALRGSDAGASGKG